MSKMRKVAIAADALARLVEAELITDMKAFELLRDMVSYHHWDPAMDDPHVRADEAFYDSEHRST